MMVLTAFSSFEEAGARTCDFRSFARSIADQIPSHRKLLMLKSETYDRLLMEPILSEPHLVREKIADILDAVEPFSPSFHRKAFMKWLDKNPITNEELKLLINHHENMGQFLKRRLSLFENKKQKFDLGKFRDELDGKLKEVQLDCGKSIDCQEKKLEPWIIRKLKDSCLAKNPLAVRNMITGFAISNTATLGGYFLNPTAEERNHGFPYEILIDRTLMTPIFSEIGCRGNLGSGHPVGEPLNFKHEKVSFLNRAKKFGETYKQWFIWSRVQEADYLAWHFIVEKSKGNEVDLSLANLTQEMGALFLYDSAYSVVQAGFIDPLFFKKYPQLKQWIRLKSNNRALGEVIYTPIDLASRWAIGLAGNRAFQEYEQEVRKTKIVNQPYLSPDSHDLALEASGNDGHGGTVSDQLFKEFSPQLRYIIKHDN